MSLLGTIHKRRLPKFPFFRVPSFPLSPHGSFGSQPLGETSPQAPVTTPPPYITLICKVWVKNWLWLKAPKVLLYLHETWSKFGHEVIVLTKFHKDSANIDSFLLSQLVSGNILSEFKGKIKDSPILQRGSLPPSPNVSFLGYPLPPPLGRRLLWMVPMPKFQSWITFLVVNIFSWNFTFRKY